MPITVAMSFAERTAYAGKMIVIGMGAVFLSLAILWGVVEIFRRLVTRTPDEAPKPVQQPVAAPVVKASPAPVATASNDALIAAITAAVAATLAEQNGGVAPAFRVVSFQRVPTVSKRK